MPAATETAVEQSEHYGEFTNASASASAKNEIIIKENKDV
jgi:hypothetical protein